ncbi:MAG: hypothetical protein A2086_09690 [Spirochaetes bacterium GWD1_27_9]|nr:MAG: hypothetical protein A2Z98_11940 [Spirochaetes bacterium GWB1_27_13]OHD20444.1 MAG: hypothetical protein A2Y34_02050 [Spirochaetes bacterium GWC1_27_15]OHD32016.1 MAG: hypothetical protein A2086_09690 [Spirochaetes bacterium GWD1_27_9]
MNFENIYKDYKEKIGRFIFTYTKDKEEQEELLQDIFYNIFLSLSNFKNKSSLNTYIYSIARNVCVKYIKNKIKERKRIENLIINYDERIQKIDLDYLIQKEEVKFFYETLDKLEDAQKEVFILAEVENLKYEEISKILNIPTGTVKSRLNRAKVNIMKLLGDKYE